MKYAMLVLLLAGCAAKEGAWNKGGSTAADFSADRGQCIAQAYAVPGAPANQVAIVFAGCMQGKGWQWVEAR